MPPQKLDSHLVNIIFPQKKIVEKEVVKAYVESLGVEPQRIVELSENHREILQVYFSTRIQAQTLVGALHRLKGAYGLTVQQRLLKKEDWQNKWKTTFKPFKITKDLTIVPWWLKRKYKQKKNEQVIYINTTFAFGSGLHETTRIMAGVIARYAHSVNNFLDVGTGTGILTLIALKSGISRCQAIEIDPDAAIVAKNNFKTNGFKNIRVQSLDFSKFKSEAKFDLVVANLITHDLIQLKHQLVRQVKPKKYLAVSGISKENYPLLRKSFKTLLLKCVRVVKGKEWVGILYQRI